MEKKISFKKRFNQFIALFMIITIFAGNTSEILAQNDSSTMVNTADVLVNGKEVTQNKDGTFSIKIGNKDINLTQDELSTLSQGKPIPNVGIGSSFIADAVLIWVNILHILAVR